MKLTTATIITSLAFAAPAATQESDPGLAQRMVAAGALKATVELCEGLRIEPEVADYIEVLEVVALHDHALWMFYDAGVGLATRAALPDRKAYCAAAQVNIGTH